MDAINAAVDLRPPLKVAWTSTVDLALAVDGGSVVYGISNAGKLVAIDAATGAVRWTTTTVYLRTKLTVRNSTLYAYRKDLGLAIVTDQGPTYQEKVIVSINPLTEADPVSNIETDGTNIYMVINQALLVLKHDGDLVAGTNVGTQTPYSLTLTGSSRCVVIDGYGQPQLFELRGSSLSRLWYARLSEPGTGPDRRPAIILGEAIVTGGTNSTQAFHLATGALLWQTQQVPAALLVPKGFTVYAIGKAGQVIALQAASGQVLWRRMYLSTETNVVRVAAVVTGNYLYVAAWVSSGGPIHLFALQTETGTFEWQAPPNVQGFPALAGDRLIVYGTSSPALGVTIVPGAKVGRERISWSPNPLRGPSSAFQGALTIDLPVKATLTVTALREVLGGGDRLLDRVVRLPGVHQIPWSAGGTGGFDEQAQFGRIMVEVSEEGGPSYSVTQLVPVNTLPDLLAHWAQQNIEVMIYRQFISGYPDLLFRPDNLVTRAECSTIIAKTLGIERPSSGFRTKFKDIASHWARQQIMALEERQIIGGFEESDGTFTFRPDINMTRAQEARILVKAYTVPNAPPGFSTKFIDIQGHWAKGDIEALEAAGYVNGFREGDGAFTYRPEQSLTRAELCTVVVRIRKLTR